MNEQQEEYLNLSEVDEVDEMEQFVYDSAATPKRTIQLYKISYEPNLSKNAN